MIGTELYESLSNRLNLPIKKDQKKMGNNRYLRREGDNIVFRLHNTDLVTITPEGVITLRYEGWATMVTCRSFEEILPYRFSCKDGLILLYKLNEEGLGNDGYYSNPFTIQDGTLILPDGTIENAAPSSLVGDMAAKKKAILKYAEKFADAFILRQVPLPSGGCCFDCQFGFNGTEHLDSHLEEEYFVPSLLARAVENAPSYYREMVWRYWGDTGDGWWDQVWESVRNYVAKFVLGAYGINSPTRRVSLTKRHRAYLEARMENDND
jgi:hypothetical protein